jgi:hypothetical protein
MAEDSRDPTQAVTPATISSNGSGGEALLPTVQGEAPTWQTIVGYFQKAHPGRFLLDETNHAIQWLVTLDNGTYRLVMRYQAKSSRLHVRVPHILTVPQQKHIATALLINLINEELFIGHFQLDTADGEVAYRCNLAVAESQVGEEQLETYCYASVTTVDSSLPAFHRLIFAEASPEEAFAAVE